MLVIAVAGQPYCLHHAAVLWNACHAEFNHAAHIVQQECGGFHGGGKHLRVNTLAAVVDAGIIVGIFAGHIRHAREEACPYLGADPGAIAPFPDIIVA